MNISLFIIYLAFHGASSQNVGNETDYLSLLEFKKSITDDPLRVLSSWNSSIHFCNWDGVICGHLHRRVRRLDLQSSKLSGSISPHLGNMSFLTELYLPNNSLTGGIPPDLGRLRRLQDLTIFNNSLGGKIPVTLFNCSNLRNFDLANINLVGKIPVQIGTLSKLQNIYLQYNSLTGEIPSSIGNLSSLVLFEIIENAISGSIPEELGKLSKMQYILLSGNKIYGIVPPSVYNLTYLKVFSATQNQLQGTLPSDLGVGLPNLQDFLIGENKFTGKLPASLGNASQLFYFFILENRFTGPVPSFETLYQLSELALSSNPLGRGGADDLSFISTLTNATGLQLVEMSDCGFGGMLPVSLGNLSSTVVTLYMENNRISGDIPNGIGNLVNLEEIDMSNNQLTGEIPNEFGRLLKLHRLYLSINKLSGNIPPFMGNLSLLLELLMGVNDFQGNIPFSLGNLENVQVLDLSWNSLNGQLPPQIFKLPSLTIALLLSHNQLSGTLPEDIGTLKNLEVLGISENVLSGNIPSSLGSCSSLEYLYMQGNLLQGNIPESFSSLRGLRLLDVSRNNLTGRIPLLLEGLNFTYLNLSFNNFVGSVPEKGIFLNASAIFLSGNAKLCGGIPQLQLPKCISNQYNKKNSKAFLKIVLPVTFLCFLGTALLLLTLYLCLFRKKRENTPCSEDYSLLRVTYQSLLKSTDGFSSSNLIGAGGFGSVYKGVLEDGKLIAVKVLDLQHRSGSKSFVAECRALTYIRHRNIVKVLTSCSGNDYLGNDFKAVVYEYMVNGSLEQWLYHREYSEDADPRHLNILQRLNIVIDIAAALDYLHNQCVTAVVHCDIKPSNVLLDHEMVGHLGDFGLARLIYENSNIFSSQQSSSIGVKGSIGYTPPEYGMGSAVSKAGDVYSYAILLLEMFTGKRPTDDMFKGGMNLHNFVMMSLPERVLEISDPILLQHGEEENRSTNIHSSHNDSGLINRKIRECLIFVYRIGVACSSESRRERMDISQVLTDLVYIKNNFLQAGGMQGP